MKKLLVGVCTRGADIHYRTYEFMSQTVFNTPGAQMVVIHSPYQASSGQEKLFDIFHEGGYEHMLLVDADVVPPLDAYTQLVKHNKPIVLAPVWFYDDDTNAVFYGAFPGITEGEDDSVARRIVEPRNKGFERIVSGGFGCMLVRRDVVERFKSAKESVTEWSNLIPEKLKKCPSDTIFWAKCFKFGIEVYIDWSIETIHYRTVGLSNSLINKLRRKR